MRWHLLSASQLVAQDLPQPPLLKAGQLHSNGTTAISTVEVQACSQTQQDSEMMCYCWKLVHAANSRTAE